MATKAPKSILKTPSNPGTLAADQASAAKAREIATTHAKIIHHRRDLEDQISDSIIELCKLPCVREPRYTSSNPSPSDIATFKSNIRLFQPGDYDDLIEERNANGSCGFTLCPSPRTRLRGGEWKIVGSNIIPKKEVEKWCSQACAKRAMYVKVQLNETAAWERAEFDSIEIELYEEPAQRIAKDMSNLQLETGRDVKNARELALERGDTGGKGKDRPVPVVLQEKSVTGVVEGPSLDGNHDGHLVLEGYKTKLGNTAQGTAEKTK